MRITLGGRFEGSSDPKASHSWKPLSLMGLKRQGEHGVLSAQLKGPRATNPTERVECVDTLKSNCSQISASEEANNNCP
jgi:hypothetical protein